MIFFGFLPIGVYSYVKITGEIGNAASTGEIIALIFGGIILMSAGVGVLRYLKGMGPPCYWFVTNKRVLKDEVGGLEARLKDISNISTEGIRNTQVKIYLRNREVEELIENGGDFKNIVLEQKRKIERSKITYCRECGEKVNPSNQYCSNCGALIQ